MSKPIWAPKGMENRACCKIPYRGYEISIAMDDSCGTLTTFGRSDIRIFRDWDEKDVTEEFWPNSMGCTCHGNAENLKYIFSKIDMFGDRD